MIAGILVFWLELVEDFLSHPVMSASCTWVEFECALLVCSLHLRVGGVWADLRMQFSGLVIIWTSLV